MPSPVKASPAKASGGEDDSAADVPAAAAAAPAAADGEEPEEVAKTAAPESDSVVSDLTGKLAEASVEE